MNAVPSGADLAERSAAHLRAFALGYIHFALSEPGWFALACESQEAPPDADHDALTDPPPTPHELLLDALDAMVKAGLMSPQRRVDAEWSCWSGLAIRTAVAADAPMLLAPPEFLVFTGECPR